MELILAFNINIVLVCDVLGAENGVSILFGPDSSITSPIYESTCSRFQIPYIITSWRNTNDDDTKLTINFYPETSLLARGIADIIKNEKWKNFVVLYENEESLIKLQDVLKLQEFQKDGKKNNIYVKHLGEGPDYR